MRNPCCEKEGMKKGPWTPEEDQKLVDYVGKHGHRNWRTLPKNAGLQRCGKSCRLRWTNYLRPDIKRGKFSFEEEETIIHLHSILGNKWSAIAARLPGRTDNEIKNYWNTHIRKRLLRMGVDPVTHSPRLDLLDLSSILQNPSLLNNTSNISNLISLQQLVNPDLLKLATSLFSIQNQQAMNQIPTTSQVQNHFNTTQLHQQLQIPLTNNNSIPQQLCANSTDPSIPFSPSFYADNSGFDSQLYSSNNMTDLGFNPSQYTTENLPQVSNLDHLVQQNGCLGNFNRFYDSDNSTFQSSFGSMVSTHSSSPTPLNSNSNSIGVVTEDERESYCSNLMKFEIPSDHILDVNEFM